MTHPERDFLLSAYRVLLGKALESGYRFVSYAEIGREESPLSCLLRHDVDAELLQCGAMSAIEREIGVRATYFLMTRATNYNLFSVEGRQMVVQLLDDGHDIGLHFMGEIFEGQPVAALAKAVKDEARWLESEFGRPIRAVSFHQPTAEVLRGKVVVEGLVNTYNQAQMGSYFYVSDTNMLWRREHPRAIFERQVHQRLQLLIHPIWWTEEDMPIEQKWLRALRGHDAAVLEHWRKRERTLADDAVLGRLRKLAAPED